MASSADRLSKLRCGRITTRNGRLEAVYGRWWPYYGSLFEVWCDMRFRSGAGDRCDLYYHAPLSSPSFLTLDYVRSGPQTRYSTCYAATIVLDEIARLRKSKAIVCHITNDRISDRLLRRGGWQAHCLEWSGRHFIKRFYGEYPVISSAWRERLKLDK